MLSRQLRGDSMYYCLDCESTFDSEDTVYIWERGEFWGAPFNYNIPCCPYCKSDNIKNIEGLLWHDKRGPKYDIIQKKRDL